MKKGTRGLSVVCPKGEAIGGTILDLISQCNLDSVVYMSDAYCIICKIILAANISSNIKHRADLMVPRKLPGVVASAIGNSCLRVL